MYYPWYPSPGAAPYAKLRPHPMLAARLTLLGSPGLPATAPLPAIEPGYGFFAAGHTIGGPTGTSYRGVSASSFPSYASTFGSGGALSESALGLAGGRMFLPGILGEPWP